MPVLTPDGFVKLNRTFSDFCEDTISEQVAFDSYFSDFINGGATWETLFRHRCVVVLAEAGSGKTWELQAQTQEHRNIGRTAFFIRLERLAQRPLAECITGKEKLHFDQWLTSSNKCIFFLDAVSEAKLATRHAFEEALRSFADGIPAHDRKRIKTVITSRITGWRNREDQSLLRNLLELPEQAIADVDEKNPLAEPGDDQEKAETVAALRVVSLNPLSSKQVQSLSDHVIPDRSDEFVQALDDNDAWSFARRPQDVTRLTKYWEEKGDLGGLTDLMEFNIHSRLQETDEDRLRDSHLSEARLRKGAEALAAAVVFGKTFPILLEPEGEEIHHVEQIIPSKELPDWTPEQRKDLLSRAIFDPAAFGQVRFHHRSVAEYLAACWLDRLFEGGLVISDAISMFFVRSLGQEVLIPSCAAVACWLACGDSIWNQRIRNKLLEVAPSALLSQGDGGRLDIETRAVLLTGVVNKAGVEGEIRVEASNDQLKRLAHPDLSGVTNGLLLDPETSDDGRIVLLRLVREGKIAACAPTALDLARDLDTSNDVLIYTVAAIARAGEAAERRLLVGELLSRPSLSNRVSYVLVTEFYPDGLTGEQLVEVASLSENPRNMVAPNFPYGVCQAIIDHAPESHVGPLLEGFIHLLEQRPGVQAKNGNHSFPVSRQYLWLAPVLSAVVARALKLAVIDKGMIYRIVDALLLIELAEELERPYESRKIDIDKLSLLQTDIRRAYCWHKVQIRTLLMPADNVSIHDIFQNSTPLDVSKDDIKWLYGDLHQRNSFEHRRLALHLVNDLWWYFRLGHGVRTKIRGLVFDDIELRRQFRKKISHHATLWVMRWRSKLRNYFKWQLRNDLRGVKAVYWRYRNFYRLRRDLRGIASGEYFEHLWHLYNTRPSPEAVKIKYGKKIADAYLEGCKAIWRTFIPVYTHEQPDYNTIDGRRVSVGLLGLQFDLDDGLDLSSLGQEDASRATRYAVKELNNFPDWLAEIAESQPEATREILRNCVTADWQLVGPNAWGFGVGHKLYHASPRLWLLMAENLLALITNGDPGSSELLLSTVGVVLRGKPDAKNNIAAVARCRIMAGTHTSPLATQWFIIWLWLDADNALDWLEKLSESKPQAEVDEFLLCVGNEMNRENIHYSPTDDTPAYHSPSALCRLTIILYRHVRPVEDIHRGGTGAYSPNARDHAQDFRNAIVTRLAKTPGIEAHRALLDLAETPELTDHRNYVLRNAASRRLLDAEPDVWKPGDAVDFARTQDQVVRSGHDLFAVTLKRLAMLKDDLEDADFRKREGLPTEEDEDRLQEWLAHYLDEKSQGKYESLREVMVALGKKPDLHLVAPPHSPTSIEVKWADDWSFNRLCDALSDQLVGRYMRARRSRHGVLLLCYRGKKQHWKPDGENGVTFAVLVDRLNDQAKVILDKRWDIDGLKVIRLNFSDVPPKS